LQIYGTGKQSRCFCYVGDVIDAVVSLMANDQAYGEVFNIGSSEEVTIEGLADKIIEKTGSKSIKEYISYEDAYGRPIDDMMRRVPGIDKISQIIGWHPSTDLDRTLDLIIKSNSDSQ
jgi:UDP-glucose 4-epimerase